MVSSDTESPNSSCSRTIRSQARQRTTPWTAGSGPRPRSGGERLCAVVELGRRARRRNVDETVRPLLVEPDYPVTQRLAIHPAELRCFFTRNPVQHRRKRQKPSRLRPILRALRKPPNLTGRIVRPNRHRLAHDKHPSFANFNHVTGIWNPPKSPNRSSAGTAPGRKEPREPNGRGVLFRRHPSS